MGLIEAILTRLFPPEPEPIADLRPGRRVHVRGRVVPRDVIDSPLTTARCVYYRYSVQEWRKSVGVGDAGFWVKIEDEEAIAEFYLQDDSGRAIVAPQHAMVEVPPRIPAEPVEVGMVGRRGFESRIEVGDVVEVEAMAERIDDLLDDARGYRDSAARVILHAPDGGVLRIRLVAKAS